MANMLRTFKRSILHARLEKAGMGNLNKPKIKALICLN